MVEVEHDPKAGALYVRLKSGQLRHTEEIENQFGLMIMVDLDDQDNLIGFEVLY